jgi:transposase
MKFFVGLDVSLKETAICLVDADGIIIAEAKTASEPDAISAWLTERDVPGSRVGLEIGGLSRWLYIELKARGWPAICIDPRRLRGLTKTMPVKRQERCALHRAGDACGLVQHRAHQERRLAGAAHVAGEPEVAAGQADRYRE